jgi:hypothetical protein
MKTLRVQFVRKPPAWGYVVGALAVGLCLLAGVRLWDALNLHWRTQYVRAETASLQAHVAALNGKISNAQRSPPYQVGAAQAVREAEFPVEAALVALEGVTVVGVKMTSVIVLPADGSAQAELEYQSPDALAKYLQQLAQLPMQHEWRLLKVQSESPASGQLGQSSHVLSPAIAPSAMATSTATLIWGGLPAPTLVK